jgi:cytidylate kinase
MNTKEKFVVTINRQFGSGGREIAIEVAKRLGVKAIDKEVLAVVAEKLNMTEKEVAEVETQRPSWWSDFSLLYKGFMGLQREPAQCVQVTSRQVFVAQSTVIRKIAEKESCVVIGRCGFNIFKEHPNALHIFLHKDADLRVKRIVEKHGLSEQDARRLISDNDNVRETYTKTFTGRDRYDARNYHLSLDISSFSVPEAVDYLLDFIKR